MIRGGYAMQTGEPATFPEDPNELRELAMRRFKTSTKLGNAPSGSGHSNFLKGIGVSFDMKITQALLPQFERYHWAEIISSQSKMHRITKCEFEYHPYTSKSIIAEFESMINVYNDFDNFCDDAGFYHYHTDGQCLKLTKPQWFEAIVYSCPIGLQLWMGVDTNYLQLQTMVNQRHNHKLTEWHEFCTMCKELPLFTELAYDKNR